MDVNKELKFFCENSKKFGGRGVRGAGRGEGQGVGLGGFRLGGQGGCKQRIEVFVIIQKKN